MRVPILLLAVVLTTSCFDPRLARKPDFINPQTSLVPPPPPPAPVPPPVTGNCNIPSSLNYTTHVLTIVNSYCAGCHSTFNQIAGINFWKYATDSEAKQDREVFEKALSRMKSNIAPMPPSGARPTNCEIALIEQWLNDGQPPTTPAPPGPPPPPASSIGASTVFTLENNEPRPLVRRLTKYEYSAAVAALTGVTPDVSTLGGEVLYFNLPTEATALKLTGVVEANNLLTIATNVSMAANIASVITCGSTSCSNAQITVFLRRAFNREPTTAEIADYVALYNDAKTAKDHDLGMRTLLQAALVSPWFLYRTEIGSGPQLTARELATKLSYFIWGLPPDATLLATAENGTLLNATTYTQQVDRLLADPKAGTQLARFVLFYLGLSEFNLANKAGANMLAADAQAAMFEEVRLLVNDVLFTQKKPLRDLFTSPNTFMNNTIGTLYGMSISGSNFRKVPLNTAQRLGILSTPLVLAAHSKQSGRSPMTHGHFLVKDLMCLAFPPEAGTPVMNLPTTSGLTMRQAFAAIENQSPCLYCHRSMNAGFAFDGFDVVGRRSATVADSETTGIFNLPGDPSQSFQGPVEAANYFATHREVQRCFVSQLFRFGQGRYPGMVDMPIVSSMMGAAPESSVLDLMRSLALSKQFKEN